ncbi:unnamed protein product, partial [Larinioides sclopetarius]
MRHTAYDDFNSSRNISISLHFYSKESKKGKPLTAVPQISIPETINYRDRWRMLQRMM